MWAMSWRTVSPGTSAEMQLLQNPLFLLLAAAVLVVVIVAAAKS